MKIPFKVLALALIVIFPAAAQRAVPVVHPPAGPPGGVYGGQVPHGVGQTNLGTSLPQGSAPDLNTSGYATTGYATAGVGVQTGNATGSVIGDVNSEVVDSGPSDEERALEYLEYSASRIDPVGSAPIIEKMRRIRK